MFLPFSIEKDKRMKFYKKVHETVTDLLSKKPKTDFVRTYEADAIECLKCDNWEEGNVPWHSFDYINEVGHYRCNKCGTFCIRESSIIEYRDEE